LPKIRHRGPEMNWRNHIVTLREDEVPEEGKVVLKFLFPEVEEEAEKDK
jgi:hypothetical protein